jgi:hypothetical protein
MDHQPEDIPLLCRRCGNRLTPGQGNYYRVTIEAVADPAPPDFCAEDLAQDFEQQIKQLLDRLRNVTEREAMDQVFRRVVLYLCINCYRSWIDNPTG